MPTIIYKPTTNGKVKKLNDKRDTRQQEKINKFKARKLARNLSKDGKIPLKVIKLIK